MLEGIHLIIYAYLAEVSSKLLSQKLKLEFPPAGLYSHF
jgi:hypothetical protein